MYQELASDRACLGTSLTCATHWSSASPVASMHADALLAHIGEAVGDPVDMLLDRDDHVRQHRRAARTGDDEHVGKARDHQAEIGLGPCGPFRRSVSRRRGREYRSWRTSPSWRRSRSRTPARRIRIPCRRRARPSRVISSIGVGLDIDQRHVVAVERLEIFRVDADALGADRMVVRLQQLCRRRILHDRADLFADEIRRRVVGRLVEPEVVVDRMKVRPPRSQRVSYFRGARCRCPRARRDRAPRYRCRSAHFARGAPIRGSCRGPSPLLARSARRCAPGSSSSACAGTP